MQFKVLTKKHISKQNHSLFTSIHSWLVDYMKKMFYIVQILHHVDVLLTIYPIQLL